ncbi:serine hydrolase domain-containing protein [Glaciecola petra]|uniref:Serine hydrolase n=1 Tax=Glaciecola petra TaxID=3075602 RepID=A0ABU2ZRK5_9ALTE|nr:serine hydrolase [Aestuariibacter sp. P117]MDT0595262.1 serine hydrolase [Aestuariibacter sp. P117]
MKIKAIVTTTLFGLSGLLSFALAQNNTKLIESTSTSVKAAISWPEEKWQQSTPSAEGIDNEVIKTYLERMRAGYFGPLDHFMLIRHGRVVAEAQFEHDYAAIYKTLGPDVIQVGVNNADLQYNYDHPDFHPYYQQSELHTLQSATKSVTSAVLGIAVDNALIDSIDTSAMHYFKDYIFDKSDIRRAKLTIEDLLTMRSGINWQTEGGYDDPNHSTNALESSQEWIQYTLSRPMDAEPGTVFEYNDGVSVLLGKIIREATGKRIDDYAKEHLFTPIGINDFHWKITPDGEADTEGGLYLSTHDFARFGYLFLRDGQWNGMQVISSDWVKRSVAPTVTDIAPDNDQINDAYGYQWWVIKHQDGKPAIYEAKGFGGQRLVIVPHLDLLAVFNAWDIRGRHATPAVNAFIDEIIPATKTIGVMP